MKMKIEKAILLAAGFGVRLRPITNETPKPLLPLNGSLLIDHQLKFLRAGGIREIAINLHHMGEKIKAHVGDGARYDLKIKYSEESEILGTGGGVKKAAALIGDAPFVVLNCDALIDVNIEGVIARHLKSDADATMVVKKISKDDDYNPVNVSADSFVDAFGKGNYFYAGFNIVGKKLLDLLPPAGTNACLVRDGWEKLIKSGGRILAFETEGYFNDIGTLKRYEKAKEFLGHDT